MPRSVLEVCGGGDGWWLRPISVISLSLDLDQAEQYIHWERKVCYCKNHSILGFLLLYQTVNNVLYFVETKALTL